MLDACSLEQADRSCVSSSSQGMACKDQTDGPIYPLTTVVEPSICLNGERLDRDGRGTCMAVHRSSTRECYIRACCRCILVNTSQIGK